VNKVDKYISPWKPPPKTVDLPDAEEETAGKTPGKTKGKSAETPDKPEEKNEEEKKEPAAKDIEVEAGLLSGEEFKTQGYLVDSRQQMSTKRENLNQRIDEHEKVLENVKEGITMLQDYHDEFKDESETMKQTLSKFQDTVDEFDTQMGRLEDIKDYTKVPMDASNADMFEYLTEIHKKRERLRRITIAMEISICRDRFISRQDKTGESGMCRDEFEAIKLELPTFAQRALLNMKNRATFDVLRVQSKKKIMDSKLGRKKRPGIDKDGMLKFLKAVEDQMKSDMTTPLKSLLKPKLNIET